MPTTFSTRIGVVKMNNREMFDISLVQLQDPQFAAGQEAVLSFIRKMNPERVLAVFRRNAGLPDGGASPYGGWENALIGGHALGHWFSAAAMAVRAFGDEELREELQYIVRELRKCQAAVGNGFLTAASPACPEHPEIQFDIEEGKAEGKTWVPWYALHKVLAGLTDIFVYTGDEEALRAAEGLADWVSARTAGWDEEVHRRILATEYGGMNDALYVLYGLTGKEMYRKAAEAFDDPELYRHLTEDPDALDGVHANATIPKFIGALRRAEVLPGDERSEAYAGYARAFFERVVETQMYATGGIGDMEHFRKDKRLDHARTQCNAESCCVYNMMKLAGMLFERTGERYYADYIERAMLNARLGSVHPSGGTTYFNPMGTGFFKIFGNGNPDKNVFWCCTGTGMEDFASLAGNLYNRESGALIVNQYVSSSLRWPEMGICAEMKADFVSGEPFIFRIRAERDAAFSVRFRVPWWTEAFCISVPGRTAAAESEDGYVKVPCRLAAGEEVSFAINCPAKLRAVGLPDADDVLGFMYGPLVLAAELPTADPKELAEAGIEVVAPAWKIVHPGAVRLDIEYGHSFRGILREERLVLPAGCSFEAFKEHPKVYIKKDETVSGLAFMLNGYRFRPYNEIVGERYGVYWYFG